MYSKLIFWTFILGISLFISCQTKNTNQSDSPSSGQNKNEESTSNIEDSIFNLTVGKIYAIDGAEIIIREGPSEEFKGVINQKASNLLNKTIFANVDHSTKVKVIEMNNKWSKITVVEPDWLTDTHIGWIENKYIQESYDEIIIQTLNKKFFTLLLDSIDNKEFIDNELYKLGFTESLNGIYISSEKIEKKGKHVFDVLNVVQLVIFHTSDSNLYEYTLKELTKKVKHSETFFEKGYAGQRFTEKEYSFDALTPINGVNAKSNHYYDIYVYKTKK